MSGQGTEGGGDGRPVLGSTEHVDALKMRLWTHAVDSDLHEFPAPPRKNGKRPGVRETMDYRDELQAREMRLTEIMIWTARCQHWLGQATLRIRLDPNGCFAARHELAWPETPSEELACTVAEDVIDLLDIVAGGTRAPVDEECQNLILRLNQLGWRGWAAMDALAGMTHKRRRKGGAVGTPAGNSVLSGETLDLLTPPASVGAAGRRL